MTQGEALFPKADQKAEPLETGLLNGVKTLGRALQSVKKGPRAFFRVVGEAGTHPR